ncbi:unnamed protein product [Protopolystoma xenopodis]|uniref:Uncharacterized protein n=1 Tax=Protopolystoma xenopodis TaxID=117903 RepID=A0A3S5BGR3_9PLAT|nr:unnamed protein product [Protopolystoma xenopodis]
MVCCDIDRHSYSQYPLEGLNKIANPIALLCFLVRRLCSRGTSRGLSDVQHLSVIATLYKWPTPFLLHPQYSVVLNLNSHPAHLLATPPAKLTATHCPNYTFVQ